ncbi:hypothetical protein [Nostoc commune]|nr:hypothetical protein [Nostoc commune]
MRAAASLAGGRAAIEVHFQPEAENEVFNRHSRKILISLDNI